jgi:lytic murein transglycosylase
MHSAREAGGRHLHKSPNPWLRRGGRNGLAVRLSWAHVMIAVSLGLSLSLAVSPVQAQSNRQAVAQQFASWINIDLWPEARGRGVSPDTFRAAMGPVSLDWDLPDLRPPGSPDRAPQVQRQSEFRNPAPYFSERRLENLKTRGRRHLARHEQRLGAIEQQTGVPGRIIVAMWGRETDYGRANLPHDAYEALATLAFMGRRKQMFRAELLAALVMLERGAAPRNLMRSSWAGALGQLQFLPSRYLDYGVDGDGDGRVNIWTSEVDNFSSIASFLKRNGWLPGSDWGYEINLPPSIACTLEGEDKGRPISEWIAMGVTRISGRPFPDIELGRTGYLKLPAGTKGPAFLVTDNFYAIKAYNESDLYVLFIGNLADRYGRGGPFRGRWQPVSGFSPRDVQMMQERLIALGHDVGGADGLVGFRTRVSIGRWQESQGITPTCYPDVQIVRALR